MIKQARIALLSAILIASVPCAQADDVQVNTYTTGDQRRPNVATDAAGNAVVVWWNNSTGTHDDIHAQRYAADGSPVGGEFQVNSYITGYQAGGVVAMAPGGGFVVAWHSDAGSGTDTGVSVQGQRFAADGSPVGEQFQVNTYTPGIQAGPAVAVDADGDFVVVWHSTLAPGDPSFESIHGQLFTSAGLPAGEQFQVNTFTTGQQFGAKVAMADTGEFVVAWRSHDEFGAGSYSWSIHARRYDSDGTPSGPFIAVTPNNGQDEIHPAVDIDAAGNFVVMWRSFTGSFNGPSFSVDGQRFASDGSVMGGEFQVNADGEDYPRRPSVAMAPDGAFVVAWENSGGDSSFNSVQGRRYTSAGLPAGDAFPINTYTTNNQDWPSVAIDDGGNFVVVWESYGSGGTDTDGDSVQMRPLGLIFANGFESGDTSAWTTTFP